MSAETVNIILQRMQESGARITAPRRAVIEALVELETHPTAEDLAEHVAARNASVHRSSVYRTLEALSSLGLVNHVHLGHGRAVYHLEGPGAHAAPEVHLVCEDCDAVIHIDSAVFNGARSAILDETGFEIQPGHFAIPSRCPDCRAEELRHI